MTRPLSRQKIPEPGIFARAAAPAFQNHLGVVGALAFEQELEEIEKNANVIGDIGRGIVSHAASGFGHLVGGLGAARRGAGALLSAAKAAPGSLRAAGGAYLKELDNVGSAAYRSAAGGWAPVRAAAGGPRLAAAARPRRRSAAARGVRWRVSAGERRGGGGGRGG